MKKKSHQSLIFLLFIFLVIPIAKVKAQTSKVVVGANRTSEYLSLIANKKVALVVNQTSRCKDMHIVDYLLSQDINIGAIFAPEHGFRGQEDAGKQIQNSSVDGKDIPIYSVYGKNKKPHKEQLSGIETVIFDIQDVGCRFYTFISTLHYVMEACAELKIPIIVLDRPNPNGDYIAGPILEEKFQSFVGMDPIPIVHGCTMGELAQMINGEKWLKNGVQANLIVIPCSNYTHTTLYKLPVEPSPNLPNMKAIRLYPSLCFFEATSVSVGRGTTFPFQVLGYPKEDKGTFSFTPNPIKGMDTNPLHKDKKCYGEDLRSIENIPHFTLQYFLEWYNKFEDKKQFLTRPNWLNLLAGTNSLQEQITEGKTEKEIQCSWKNSLLRYKIMRRKYLLYKDFE